MRSRSWCSSDADPVGDYDALDGARLGQLFDLTSAVYASRGGAFAHRPVPRLRPAARVGPGARGHRRAAGRLHRRRVLPGPPVPEPSALLGLRLGHVRRGVPRRRDLRVEAPAGGHARPHQRQHPLHGRHGAPALPRAGAAVVPARSARRGGPSGGSSARSTRCSTAWSRTAPADLNVEFFSAIPLLTITGSFGVSVGRRARHPGGGHLRRPRHRGVRAHRARRSCRRVARNRATT